MDTVNEARDALTRLEARVRWRARVNEGARPRPYSSLRKLVTVVLLFSFYVVGYGFLNRFNLGRGHYYDLCFDFEHRIPLLPELVWAYYLPIPIISIMVLLIHNRWLLDQTVKSFLLTICVSFVLFLVLPVRMEGRPHVLPDGTAANVLLEFVYALDMPTNLFPSLHVESTVLAALITFRMNRTLGGLSIAGALLMAISVVFIKQHYLSDVAAGTFLAALGYGIFFSRNSGIAGLAC